MQLMLLGILMLVVCAASKPATKLGKTVLVTFILLAATLMMEQVMIWMDYVNWSFRAVVPLAWLLVVTLIYRRPIPVTLTKKQYKKAHAK